MSVSAVAAVLNACWKVYCMYAEVQRFKGDCAQMVRFVKCTEDILMELQGEEDFSTSAWQECLEAVTEALTEIAGLLDICARYNIIRACMSAADLQLKMGSATRNLSLALQQCDIKHNMDARSKLVELRRSMDSSMFQLMRAAERTACDLKRLMDLEAASSRENRQGHQANRELLEKILTLLQGEPGTAARLGATPGESDPGTITGQRLEQELADLKAAVACAKDSKQAQEEHYLKQIIKHIEELEAGDLEALSAACSGAAQTQPELEPPANLVCPITRCLFEDPVIVVETGHTYERRAIQEHFLVNGSTNPLTNERLRSKSLTPNLNVRWQAEDWRKQHPNCIQAAASASAANSSSAARRPPGIRALTDSAAGSSRAQSAEDAFGQLPGQGPPAGDAFALSPAAAALLAAAHAQGLDAPPAGLQASDQAQSRRIHSSHIDAGSLPAAALPPDTAASRQHQPHRGLQPVSKGWEAVSGQPRWDPESLTRSHDLAAGLRPDAEGWVGSHSRPAPWQPSSAGKADCVPDQRSRLRKAFDGVFVTSKHGTAVKMGAMGLLVDLLFRVIPFVIIMVLLFTTLRCGISASCTEVNIASACPLLPPAGCWVGMLCAVLFMVCSLLAHMLAPESLGCETCSAKLCYNHRLKTKWLIALDAMCTVFALLGGVIVIISVPSGAPGKAARDAVVAMLFLAAVSSRLLRVLVVAPWCT